jgi:hypothetical protein
MKRNMFSIGNDKDVRFIMSNYYPSELFTVPPPQQTEKTSTCVIA